MNKPVARRQKALRMQAISRKEEDMQAIELKERGQICSKETVLKFIERNQQFQEFLLSTYSLRKNKNKIEQSRNN